MKRAALFLTVMLLLCVGVNFSYCVHLCWLRSPSTSLEYIQSPISHSFLLYCVLGLLLFHTKWGGRGGLLWPKWLLNNGSHSRCLIKFKQSYTASFLWNAFGSSVCSHFCSLPCESGFKRWVSYLSITGLDKRFNLSQWRSLPYSQKRGRDITSSSPSLLFLWLSAAKELTAKKVLRSRSCPIG